MMKIVVKKTKDGSNTLYLENLDETYHSSHGALQEARHVFIKNGLDRLNQDKLTIFELGFGTGMNAYLALEWAEVTNRSVIYQGIEAFPVDWQVIAELDYASFTKPELHPSFEQMHRLNWNESTQLTPKFEFCKIHQSILDYSPTAEVADIIFYDAFGPRAQQEMWDIPVLTKMATLLKKEGLLVTYCAQGQFKRNLKQLGFQVESVPGPPGKREMTLAWKKAFLNGL